MWIKTNDELINVSDVYEINVVDCRIVADYGNHQRDVGTYENIEKTNQALEIITNVIRNDGKLIDLTILD